MKLRIRENTLRIRLTQSEVKQLAAGQSVEQTTLFSPVSRLICEVQTSSRKSVHATFARNRITIELPQITVTHWADSPDVGIAGEQRIDAETTLKILVEKDFECLHSETEQIADTYPNPRK